jgi:hypothetical protein
VPRYKLVRNKKLATDNFWRHPCLKAYEQVWCTFTFILVNIITVFDAFLLHSTFQYGLYGSFLGCFLYILFGSCKDVPMGPTAIVSLLTFQQIGDLGSNAHYYAILLCFLAGCVELLMGILGLGECTNLADTVQDLKLQRTECNEVFFGYHPCENGIVIQCFRDCLCLHHQCWWWRQRESLQMLNKNTFSYRCMHIAYITYISKHCHLRDLGCYSDSVWR